MIRVDALTFDYPSKRALEQVGFALEPGSVTALVGPNGAGKTTLLRCIAGLDQPMRGRIEVAGIDVLEQPRAAHRELGYLSDFFGLYDSLSVRRGLDYIARSRHADPGVVPRVAARLGLAEYLERPAGVLSRGLRQRLAIAQAVVHGPRVLLLDEPASGLDPEARIRLGELFLELRASGMTLLVSSHILAELEQYADGMLILRDGRVLDQRDLGRQAPLRRLELRLATPAEKLDEVLAAQPGVGALQVGAQHAEFTFEGDAAAQHALLARLLEAGFQVCALAEQRASLQEAYLAQVRSDTAWN
ncbi:MAG TPA: ABC transporter ATP-binding protein [Gammaproteobacteria bacterium]